MGKIQRIFVSTFVLASLALWMTSTQTLAQSTQTIYNTTRPSVIRVAIRQNNNPYGQILWVQTVGFEEYCSDVLANEWMSSWNQQALYAGAVAVKMFAWHHTLHPVTIGNWTFDVDNTTNFQEYKFMTSTPETDAAVQNTWNLAYTPSTGEVLSLDYRAGTPNNPNWAFVGSEMMAQWGSEYWATIGKLDYTQILNLFYPGRALQGI